MFSDRIRYYPLLCALVVTLIGCQPSGQPDNLPKLYPCSVTVTQENAPCTDAEVELFSVDPGFHWTVYGRTDSQGKASLVTHGQFPGVPAGSYKVVVSKREMFQERAPKVDPNDPTIITGGSPTIIFALIDKTYMNRSTTPLELTVAQSAAHQNFDVGKPVREKIGIMSP